MGHAVGGGEQPAHQDKNHHEKERYQHGLLLCMGHCGDQQTEAQDNKKINTAQSAGIK